VITRDEAARIALAHVRALDRGPSDAFGSGVRDPGQPTIAAVHDPAEVGRPRMLYHLREALDSCWIAYLAPRHLRLEPSHIVLVAKETGNVIYSGSANDEG
jgi:hypothetical protein